MCWEDSESEDDQLSRLEIDRLHTPPERWISHETRGVKFVDDVSAAVKCDITAAEMHISTTKEKRTIHAADCQSFFDTVKKNCQEKGMRVNDKKTQLLCISTAITMT